MRELMGAPFQLDDARRRHACLRRDQFHKRRHLMSLSCCHLIDFVLPGQSSRGGPQRCWNPRPAGALPAPALQPPEYSQGAIAGIELAHVGRKT
jgi:hypothetical protein